MILVGGWGLGKREGLIKILRVLIWGCWVLEVLFIFFILYLISLLKDSEVTLLKMKTFPGRFFSVGVKTCFGEYQVVAC